MALQRQAAKTKSSLPAKGGGRRRPNFAASRREEVNTPSPRLKAGGEEANFAAGYGASKAGGEVPRCQPREGAMDPFPHTHKAGGEATSLPAEGGGARPPLSNPRDRLSAMRSPAPGPGPLGGSRNTRVLGVGQPLSPILGARGRRQTLQRATHPRPPQHRGGLCRRCIACVGAASPRPRTRGEACPRPRCTLCTPRSEARPLASP